MKKKNFYRNIMALFCLLFVSIQVNSQPSNEEKVKHSIVLEYDKESENIIFQDKTDKKLMLEKGEKYKISIRGFNNAIFSSNYKVKPFNLSTTIPDILKPLFPGITNTIDLSFITESEATADKIGNNELGELFKSSIGKFSKLNTLKKYSDSLYKLSKIETKPSIATIFKIKILSEFKLSNPSLEEIQRKIEEMQEFINGTALAYEVGIENLYNFNGENLSSYLKLISEYMKVLDTSQNNLAEDRDFIEKKILLWRLNNKELRGRSKVMFERYVALKLMLNELVKYEYKNYASFIYNSVDAKMELKPKIFKAKKEGTEINISLVNEYIKDTVINKTIEFYNKGKFKFDFSSGFFYNDLVEKSYYIKKRDSLINNVLEEDNRSFDISIGALWHLSYELSNNTRAGISLGAAISPIDGKTRYLMGGSFIFGRKRTIAINAGVTLRKMKVLSASVRNDVEGFYVPSSVSSVPTYERTKGGVYFGISYNITSKKKY